MNGKEGDHPLTDILLYHQEIFGKEIDRLVRELNTVGGWKSEIAKDWLWIQAGEYQEAKESRDTKRMRSIRNWVRRYLERELERLAGSQARQDPSSAHEKSDD